MLNGSLAQAKAQHAGIPKHERPRIQAVRVHPASLTQNRGRNSKRASRQYARLNKKYNR